VPVAVVVANGVAFFQKRRRDRLPAHNREDEKRSKQSPTVPPEHSCKASATENETQHDRHSAAEQVGSFRPYLAHSCRHTCQTSQPPRPRHLRLRVHQSLTAESFAATRRNPLSRQQHCRPRAASADRPPSLALTASGAHGISPGVAYSANVRWLSTCRRRLPTPRRLNPEQALSAAVCIYHLLPVARSRRWHPRGFPHGGRSGGCECSTTFCAVALLMRTACAASVEKIVQPRRRGRPMRQSGLGTPALWLRRCVTQHCRWQKASFRREPSQATSRSPPFLPPHTSRCV